MAHPSRPRRGLRNQHAVTQNWGREAEMPPGAGLLNNPHAVRSIEINRSARAEGSARCRRPKTSARWDGALLPEAEI